MIDLSEQALNECQHILTSARFNLQRGLYLQGKLASVSLLVQPDIEDAGYRSVQVICHSPGHLKVDWDRVGIWMVDSVTGRNWFDLLDSRGRSRAFRVPYSDSGAFGFVNPVDVDKVVSVGTLEASALKAHAGPIGEQFPLNATSPDRRLSATVKMVPIDTLYIEVEARDESLRGSEVVLEIRSKRTGEVLYRHEFRLRFRDGLFADWSVKEELLMIDDDVDLFVHPVQGNPVNDL